MKLSVRPDVRARLIDSLVALETSDYANDFLTAFIVMRLYLAGSLQDGDTELRMAFERAQRAILDRSGADLGPPGADTD